MPETAFVLSGGGSTSPFDMLLTTLTGWISGPLGSIAALVGIGTGLFGVASSMNWKLIVPGFVGAGAAGLGPAITTGLVGAVI